MTGRLTSAGMEPITAFPEEERARINSRMRGRMRAATITSTTKADAAKFDRVRDLLARLRPDDGCACLPSAIQMMTLAHVARTPGGAVNEVCELLELCSEGHKSGEEWRDFMKEQEPIAHV